MDQRIKFLIIAFLYFSIPITSHAMMYRSVGISDLAQAMKTPGSRAFRGIVQKIEEREGKVEVTFKVEDVLGGESKTGEILLLRFPDPFKKVGKIKPMPFADIPAPRFKLNEEAVVFVTRNVRGEDFFIGGEDQSRFFVKHLNGKLMIWNLIGNANLSQPASSVPLAITTRPAGSGVPPKAISYDDFKSALHSYEK